MLPAIATLIPLADDPDSAVTLFGVTLVGVSSTTGVKLLFTVALVLLVMLLRRVALAVTRRVLGGEVADPRRFWARQGVQLIAAVVTVIGVISIWVTPGADVTTGVGLISAGLAFALQQVILSLAAYFVILRGDTFGVGDRITLGGVRGDVVKLGFLKTTIMEMGQPPAVQGADPAVWVHSRQYTGRLVTVTNGAIFQEPVYNYSRDFPYLWEEIALPVTYECDRDRAEQILLEAAAHHAVVDDPAAIAAMASMRSSYAVDDASLAPQVFWRITDNWLELSLRFLVAERGSAVSRTRSAARSSPDSMLRASGSLRPPTTSSGCPRSVGSSPERAAVHAEPSTRWAAAGGETAPVAGGRSAGDDQPMTISR